MSNLTDIILPADQLEGTEAAFSAWLVNVGDSVEKGQPIAELETDKVSMEVCAPESGIIDSLIAAVGDQIEPEKVLGQISQGAPVQASNKHVESTASSETPVDTADSSVSSTMDSTNDQTGRDSISPAVRRLLLENNLVIDPISGSGKRGRVTRNDVLEFIQSGEASPSSAQVQPASSATNTDVAGSDAISSESAGSNAAASPFATDLPASRSSASQLVPHTNMRKSIANHMVSSLLETSPHVTSVFEMDMGNIIEHRKWHKKEYQELGVKLTFTAYFLSAMAKAVASVPQVNAKFHEDALELFEDVNIGVGTALGDDGLVVPVVHQVQSMNLFQIANALNIQTEKARTGGLKPSDMKNGTLTISNHGVSGSLFATPIIINQPQVAILGIGKLEKRVVVESVNDQDTMVIRPKCYVSLSIDHRALDAHQTNLYLSKFVEIIENWGQ
jgi:2-oxoglutarate dehydrogenase E2 component (dihydrolipoamide succinyltransferase)